MSNKIVLAMVFVLAIFVSCEEGTCAKTQHNPILATYDYNSKPYQAELYRLIKESEDVDYYYEMREVIFGQNFLVVNAYGDAFCGKLCLVIPEEDVLKIPIDTTKGYQGAQLIGLKFKNQEASYGGLSLVYDSMEYIVN